MKKTYQPLYDRVFIDRNSLAVKFFQTPLGGNPEPGRLAKGSKPAPRKALPHNQLDTNMDMAGELPHPKTFQVDGISFVTDVDLDDIDDYVRKSWARFHIGPVDYLVLPLRYLHQDVDDFDINEPVFEWPEPIVIPSQTEFYAEILTPQPSKQGGFYIDCILDGSWVSQIEEPKPVLEIVND